MEYLDGINLAQLAKGTGPVPAARVIYILDKICASLQEAHDLGLVHRDIKPANILLCRYGGMHDVAQVLDFGVAVAGYVGHRARRLRGDPVPDRLSSDARCRCRGSKAGVARRCTRQWYESCWCP